MFGIVEARKAVGDDLRGSAGSSFSGSGTLTLKNMSVANGY